MSRAARSIRAAAPAVLAYTIRFTADELATIARALGHAGDPGPELVERIRLTLADGPDEEDPRPDCPECEGTGQREGTPCIWCWGGGKGHAS